jgi:hypothetical protein
MNRRLCHAVLATFAFSVGLAACSKESPASPTSAAPSATITDNTAGSTGDPCALNTDEEVRESFADAKAGERDHRLDKYGIASCTWDTPTNTFIVQIFKAKGSVDDEIRSRASGFIDPVKAGAGEHVRYEKFPDAGDDAMLLVEKGNADEGVLNDVVMLVMRRGDQMAVLGASRLIDGDRTRTLAEMAALGKVAATRL